MTPARPPVGCLSSHSRVEQRKSRPRRREVGGGVRVQRPVALACVSTSRSRDMLLLNRCCIRDGRLPHASSSRLSGDELPRDLRLRFHYYGAGQTPSPLPRTRLRSLHL